MGAVPSVEPIGGAGTKSRSTCAILEQGIRIISVSISGYEPSMEFFLDS
jgi:hypothetical protein